MVTMMFRLLLACCVAAAAVVRISAQDPTTTLPGAYKLQLENDHVRVVRVHYDAGVKLAEHTHAAGTTVYVYLNDSDGVVFRHSGRSNRAVTRPAVRTGGVRVSTGGEEHHTAENPASTPSDFLRIWLKTDGAGERTMRRLERARHPAGTNTVEEQFANKQLRLVRVGLGAAAPYTFTPAEPALLIELPSGNTRWLDPGVPATITPNGFTELLRLDLLTSPRM